MTSIPVGAPIWSDSLTSNLEADVRYYEQLFGWASADGGEELDHYTTFGIPDGSPTPGRAVMGVMPCPPGMPPSRVWNVHFKVDDCDAATERALQLGGTLMLEPVDVMAATVRVSMLTDPEGAMFGLVQQQDPEAGFGVFGEPNSVAWVEYRHSGVPAESMRFYADLLGWTVATPPWEDPKNPKPAAALSASGSDREFGGCHASEGWELNLPPQWSVMVAVENADDVCERSVELGGSVAAEPMDVPGLRIAGVAAPSGIIIGVMSPRDWE